MKPDILLLQAIMPALEARLTETFTPHRLYAAADKAALLAEVGPKIRGVITGGAVGIRNEMMDALPALEIIAINGVGTDAVDLVHAHARGIRVTNTPGVLTDDVADLALGLIIATLRGIPAADRFVRNGEWEKQAAPLTRKVSGKHIGILGLGQIGLAIARRLTAFDCTVRYHSRRSRTDAPYAYLPDAISLARASDVLVLAASADQGQALVTREVLDALGAQGFFINIARGRLVDEAALVEALQQGRIAGAGLDVFANEPHVPPALLALDNVVLLPHRGSATIETRLQMGQMVLDNLDACFGGRPLPSAVA
jgi:lactate dehydrogenase-like 2-hydroxyacid dehydrogenase